MSKEAMQLALEALESVTGHFTRTPSTLRDSEVRGEAHKAITALRQALVDADDTSQERVDEIVKTEHDKQIEIALAYQRGWDAALAQQEPVAWISEGGDVSRSKRYMDEMGFKCNPLYTAPPKREWVGLTLNEAEEFYDKYTDRAELINAIDKFLEEKNT